MLNSADLFFIGTRAVDANRSADHLLSPIMHEILQEQLSRFVDRLFDQLGGNCARIPAIFSTMCENAFHSQFAISERGLLVVIPHSVDTRHAEIAVRSIYQSLDQSLIHRCAESMHGGS
jgi:hypothetical protein